MGHDTILDACPVSLLSQVDHLRTQLAALEHDLEDARHRLEDSEEQ
jgi:hypothetical protein